MATTPGGVGGGGFRPRVDSGTVSRKETSESKDTKGAEGKGDVKGGGGAGGAKAAKGKGKAKGKDLGTVGALLGGGDQWVIEDDEHQDRRRRAAFFDEEEQEFAEQDATRATAGLGQINAEFRAQVAAGMAAGRTFTKGSVGVKRKQDEEEEEEDG